MKIGSVKPPVVSEMKKPVKKAVPPAAKKPEETDRLVRSGQPKKLTYGKPVGRSKDVAVRGSKALKKMIMDLLARQEQAAAKAYEAYEQERAEAAALIADDGPLGAEAVSDRIVEFAKSLAGGDKSKIGLIREAIKEGFRQAAQELGGLPEVSLRTYDLVMEKLDRWENGEE